MGDTVFLYLTFKIVKKVVLTCCLTKEVYFFMKNKTHFFLVVTQDVSKAVCNTLPRSPSHLEAKGAWSVVAHGGTWLHPRMVLLT